MKYQLKPKQIDAYQFTGDIKDFKENIAKEHYTIGCDFKTISINSAKGRQILNIGDYLVAGPGRYYEIWTKAAFEDMYQPAPDNNWIATQNDPYAAKEEVVEFKEEHKPQPKDVIEAKPTEPKQPKKKDK
jgi:hypothetical protein